MTRQSPPPITPGLGLDSSTEEISQNNQNALGMYVPRVRKSDKAVKNATRVWPRTSVLHAGAQPQVLGGIQSWPSRLPYLWRHQILFCFEQLCKAAHPSSVRLEPVMRVKTCEVAQSDCVNELPSEVHTIGLRHLTSFDSRYRFRIQAFMNLPGSRCMNHTDYGARSYNVSPAGSSKPGSFPHVKGGVGQPDTRRARVRSFESSCRSMS